MNVPQNPPARCWTRGAWDSSRSCAGYTTGSPSPMRSTSTSHSTAIVTAAGRSARGWGNVRCDGELDLEDRPRRRSAGRRCAASMTTSWWRSRHRCRRGGFAPAPAPVVLRRHHGGTHARRDVSHRASGGGHGTGRQLLHHRAGGRAAICDAPSAAGSRRCKQPSDGSVQGFVSE